ncbi:hypothetical protein HW053_001484 [Campylobacter jejuni]|nr:hypothetical protein [Campylobacter jejuni]EFS7927402.1 hypothetical protein [Campylobacter jejuni]MBX1020854.1 hypothetical protein [Campylobacter jejuni]HED5364331.1 hypothetical protein [Campylobacter jejuni]HEG5317644.1 hypothetical protein [Campylobacter jejuni]
MLEIIFYILILILGFSIGILVANNNKEKTKKIIDDLKKELEKLKNKD